MRFPRPSRDILVLVLAIVLSVIGLGFVYGLTVLQFLKDGLVVGSIYVLGATGLSLIFGIRKFANFAHGELMTFGAYMAFVVNVLWAATLSLGLVFAIVTTAGIAMAMELLVFRKLAGKGPVPALVASIGITIFLQNLINLIFGTSIQIYNLKVAVDIDLLAVNGTTVLSINPLKGILTLGVAIALIVLLHLLLSRTTLGKAMRATADNPDLARTSGIKIRNVILWTWIISGAMAAVAGVLLGIVTDVRPGLGFHILLFVFAAVIVGIPPALYELPTFPAPASIFALMALALNLQWGHTGLFNGGVAAFWAIGAYTAAILMTPYDPASLQYPGHLGGFSQGFFIAAFAAILLSALVGLAIAIPILRLRADYSALPTSS